MFFCPSLRVTSSLFSFLVLKPFLQFQNPRDSFHVKSFNFSSRDSRYIDGCSFIFVENAFASRILLFLVSECLKKPSYLPNIVNRLRSVYEFLYKLVKSTHKGMIL